MRALAKDPGQRFQSADAFIAALDAALKEPGAGDGTADFAALPPVVAAPVEAEDEVDPGDEARKRRRRWIYAAIAAVLIGVLVGLALTRDTTTEVPDVTGEMRSAATQRLERNGFSVAQPVYVERSAPANEVLEQDPLGSPPAGKAELDCSFLTFFCSKPKVTLTVSSGPGSGKVPATAGLSQEEATELLEDAGFEVDVESANSDSVEEGTVIHSEPQRRQQPHPRRQRRHRRLQGPEADQGPGPGRQPAPPRGAADPRPRPDPERLRRRKRLAGGRGDQPVAERRQRGRSGLDRGDHRSPPGSSRRRCRT